MTPCPCLGRRDTCSWFTRGDWWFGSHPHIEGQQWVVSSHLKNKKNMVFMLLPVCIVFCFFVYWIRRYFCVLSFGFLLFIYFFTCFWFVHIYIYIILVRSSYDLSSSIFYYLLLSLSCMSSFRFICFSMLSIDLICLKDRCLCLFMHLVRILLKVFKSKFNKRSPEWFWKGSPNTLEHHFDWRAESVGQCPISPKPEAMLFSKGGTPQWKAMW